MEIKPTKVPMTPEYVRSLVAAGLNKARMERACFSTPEGIPGTDEKYSAEVKAAIKLYMDSWVIGPLEMVFDALETGDKRAIKDCKDMQRYHISEYYAEKALSEKRMAPRSEVA